MNKLIEPEDYEVIPPDHVCPVFSLMIEDGYLDGMYASPDAAIRAFKLDKEVLGRVVKESRTTDHMGVITMELIDKLTGEER